MSPVIDISGLSCALQGSTILHEVCLSVSDGEYLSVIGPNGAGKTTLIKCIMRIIPEISGTISVCGKPLHRYRQHELARLVSYVPQSTGSLPMFTVEEFIMMSRYPHLSPFTSVKRTDRDAVTDALQLTGTAPLAHRHLATLSGGERQTVAVASALAQGARIMLLDEPTTFLDPRHAQDVLRIIARINRERGITIVSVTHDINSAALSSDRVGILKDGRFVYVGEPSGMMSNSVLSGVYGATFTFVPHPASGFPVIVPGAGVS